VRAARRDGDAVTPAREALLLAEAAGDVPGMAAAHSRLKTLLRKTDPSAAAEHARRADAYHARTSRGGSP
jgi:hypothetical protein